MTMALRKLTKPEKVHDRMATDLTRNAMVAPAVVDDPYSTIAGEKIRVTRSLRDDTLAWMYSRSFIDTAEFSAGRKWEQYVHWAEIGGVRAIDPTKEAVDGKRLPEPITDRQIEAMQQLRMAEGVLGMEGASLVRDILTHQLTITMAAARRYLLTEQERKYLGRRFRECLDTLAEHWGLATKKLTGPATQYKHQPSNAAPAGKPRGRFDSCG
jgi:hypothetical protein